MPHHKSSRFVELSCLLSAVFAALICTVAAAPAQEINFLTGTAFTESNVIMDSEGNLYGTSQLGGTSSNCHALGCGTVFEVSPSSGGGWTESILYSFSAGSDGQWPAAGLVRDSAGNLYGTTQYGGSSACSCGVVFKLSPSAGSTWTETILYRFTGGSDGSNPVASLTLGAGGELFGTASAGGTSNAGVIFKLTDSAVVLQFEF